MNTKIAAIGLLIASSSAFAIVDMRNANYSTTLVDLEVPGSGYDLKIARTYNSRSLFNGMFGFGWCSDFETTLEVTAEGNMKLTECGAGQEIFFTPREFSKKDVDKTISQIIDKLKETKKDPKFLANLKEQLANDPDLRSKYAGDLKLSFSIKEGAQFFANGQEVENITFSKGQYTRNMADGTMQRFTGNGKLSHLYDKNGNYLKFEYDKDSIRDISDNNGRKLSFKFYANRKVKIITGPNNLSVEYKFAANLDDLINVKNSWGNTYTFEYDDLHNLTKINWPDKKSVALSYDKKKDWVTSFTDRDGCNEVYNYEFSEKEPKNHYWSTVKKTCGKEVTNESKHEFWYKNKPGGQAYLSRVLSIVNGNTTDITYHDVFGKPVAIQRNNERFTFEFYPNGLVKTKVSGDTKLSFEYDEKIKKPSLVVSNALNTKGKIVATRKTTFKYDAKGNLTYAQNTDGQKITMTYDQRGRIASILDQAKKVVKIDYEDRFGKPSVVSRPGLGTIKVTYKGTGDIDKVDSPEGPSVAMQVASTFNNLLEIISPASAEVFN